MSKTNSASNHEFTEWRCRFCEIVLVDSSLKQQRDHLHGHQDDEEAAARVTARYVGNLGEVFDWARKAPAVKAVRDERQGDQIRASAETHPAKTRRVAVGGQRRKPKR